MKGQRKGFYNLPGGRADRGQCIQEAVQRQLFQQTGLKGTYQYVAYFRELSKSIWGSSDIYFVCMIQVKQQQFKNMKLCEQQIQGFKWVHLNDYHEFIQANAVGTQIQVSRHITQLYKSGFKFQSLCNSTYKTFYSLKNKIPYVGHFVLNPETSTFPNENGIQQSAQFLG